LATTATATSNTVETTDKAAALQPLRFGDFLIEQRLLDEGQLLDALADHWMSGCAIGESVVRRGYLTEQQLAEQLIAYEQLAVVYV
jgi:hypothetical protein